MASGNDIASCKGSYEARLFTAVSPIRLIKISECSATLSSVPLSLSTKGTDRDLTSPVLISSRLSFELSANCRLNRGKRSSRFSSWQEYAFKG